MRCLGTDLLARRLAQELSAAEEVAIQEHIDGCEGCFALLCDVLACAPAWLKCGDTGNTWMNNYCSG